MDMLVKKTLKNRLNNSFKPVFGAFSHFLRFWPILAIFVDFISL
jgi:hypothetical protein